MILKKGWLSDLKILKICEQVNREEYIQQEPPTQIETQNIDNQNITEPCLITSMGIQEGTKNEELKKSWLQKRLRYYTIGSKAGKSQGRNRKRLSVIKKFPNGQRAELCRIKLVSDKISIARKKPNRNTKFGKAYKEMATKMKAQRRGKHSRTHWNKKTKTKEQTSLTI